MKKFILFVSWLCVSKISLCMDQNVPTSSFQRFETKINKLTIITVLALPELVNRHEEITQDRINSALYNAGIKTHKNGILIIYENDNNAIPRSLITPSNQNISPCLKHSSYYKPINGKDIYILCSYFIKKRTLRVNAS